jgi:spore coat protein CotH
MRNLLLTAALLPLAAITAADLPEKHILFDGDAVHEMHLRFNQPDWYAQLLANFNGNIEDVPYIEASFEWGSFKFDKVGVRIKGNSTARVNSVKKPFRIKFNEYTKGQKIDGVGSINCNNINGDASMVREKAYFELARQSGLTAPRMNWTALYINGEYWGLYFLGEVINDDFIKMHFPKEQRDGWLYKGDIGSTFEYWGEDGGRYGLVFEKKTYEDENDWSDLIKLTRVLAQTPDEQLEEKIGELLDIDSFLGAMALDNLTVNLDSYVTMTQNFYIYRRPTDGKFQWLVWDPSLAFGSFAGGLTAVQMKTMPLEYVAAGLGGGGGFPGGGGPAQVVARPLATRLWAVPSIKARYREIYARLVQEVYLADNLFARMNAMRDLIRPWVVLDKNKLTSLDAFDRAMTQDAVAAGPGGAPGVPGGPGGGGMGGGPAIEPLVRDRKTFVLKDLGLNP